VSANSKKAGPSAASARLADTPEPLPGDRLLLDRFRRGDRDALAQIYRYYRDPILAMLRGGFAIPGQTHPVRFRGVGSAVDAEDLLIDTFRKAFAPSARARYGGLGSFGGYLRAITRNLVIDRLRKKEHLWEAYEETRDAGDTDGFIKRPTSPRLRAERAELRALIADFVETLAEVEATLMRLRFVDGLSQRDAAAEMSVTRRWVRDTETGLRLGLTRHLEGTDYLPTTARGSL
jgi:RNA polymerase sigma factor (sigma-70 family)